MAPQPGSARSVADEAGLMWLDDADLLSVVEPSFTAAESGSGSASIVARSFLPGLGLFAAVLFGHVILAASGQSAPTPPKHNAPLQQPAAPGRVVEAERSKLAAVEPPATADLEPANAGESKAITTEGGEGAAADAPAASVENKVVDAAADSDERKPADVPAAAGSGDTVLAKHAATEPPAPTTPREKSGSSHRQHYAEGAHGSGASSEPAGAVERNQQPGLLRVNSRPWAQVTLDGRALGNTPLLDVQVAPGTHTLRLDNPDFQLSKTLKLDVAAGETVTRVVSLQD